MLKTKNLTIGYPGKALYKNISVNLKKGFLTGLVGQNGVGKSTFIRTLCGIQSKLSGDIFLDGRVIQNYNPKKISRQISIVLTGKPETLNLSVIELIALGRYPYSGWLGTLTQADKQKIEEAITQMEINYIATKRLYELSDGQLQKVMIARALAQDTDLIILDEPTSHLDLKNKIDVLALLKKVAEQGKTILISTHEIDLASEICNTFWCMDFGKPILEGNPKELIEKGKVQEYLHVENEVLLKK